MKFTKEQESIVCQVAEHIVSLPSGTNMTTWQAIADLYPELREEAHRRESDFMGVYFFEWHFAICAEVERRGRTLDFSAHDGKVEGLPYNLDFILR